MRVSRLVAAALLAALAATLLPACTFRAADAPGGPCAGQRAPGDICVQAVELAQARLDWLHPPISSVTFRRDLCAPNMRCPAPLGGQGWVIFEFVVRDPPVMIYVGPPDPADDQALELVARPPEPLPDWLLEELEAGVAGQANR